MKSKDKKLKEQKEELKDSESEKSAAINLLEYPFFSSRIFEILLFFFIMGLAFTAGLLFLSSDPPHISWSQDVATDPPQYTYFARNKALWGSWDLFGHNRFIFFLKSFSSVASLVVFSIFGTGRFQANLVAVILNLFTIVLLFLALKKVFGKRMGFLSLFLLGTNFVFIMYGRNPFLEISALFLLTLGFYLMVSSFKKIVFLIPSGLCFALAIFFGKTMAAFILPACLGALLLWTFEQSPSSSHQSNFKPLVSFGSGFVLGSLFWVFFSYLPAKKEVVGYFGEQAFGLYGFPFAFQSIYGFIASLFTFGTDVFYRMPVVFLLSLLGLFWFFQENSTIRQLTGKRDDRSKVKFFLVFWFLTAFFLLMSLNYRPLRYQLYLIPPMCALAGLWLDSFLSSFGSKRKSRPGVLFWIVLVLGVTFSVNYVILMYHVLYQKQYLLNPFLIISAIIGVVSGILYYWRFAKYRRKDKGGKLPDSKSLSLGHRFLIVFILILISLLVNGWQYTNWASRPTYSLNRSSLDLGMILNEEAVISGPYGPALAWDNKLKNVIHMFGVTQPDPQLFHTYPITHLALERGEGGNRDLAFRDYPQVMNKAKLVTTYWLRYIPVDIYRIGEWTGNPKTETYPLTDFEKAGLMMEKGATDSALALLERFIDQHPENYSGYKAMTEIYYDMEEYEKAALTLEKAAQFNPTDFVIHQQLGAVYISLAIETDRDSYRLMAIEQWEESLKLFPQNTELADKLKILKEF